MSHFGLVATKRRVGYICLKLSPRTEELFPKETTGSSDYAQDDGKEERRMAEEGARNEVRSLLQDDGIIGN
jgi:hypothetical protein